MCGIVGYIGHEQAAPILLDGLAKLEYRGYDSAGVVVFSDKSLKVIKAKGRLANLSNILDGGKALKGNVGVGHTRWATHGAPSDINSHPHLSGKVAVVHNGIIENYASLKAMLIDKGRSFLSETDTEVIACLIDYLYEGDILAAVQKALPMLEGAFALGIACEDNPDMLIAARKSSPLILGLGEGCNYLASDVPAILKYTREVIYLDDGDIAVVKQNSIDVYNGITPVDRKIVHIDLEISAAEKCGYEHYMLKEIMEQPEAVRKTLSWCVKNGKIAFDTTGLTPEYVKALKRIYIVACGSAYYAGVVAKYNIEKLVRIPVEAVLASEFRYSDPLVDENTLVIIISQSGETADTLAALRETKRRGGRTIAIVNVVGSSIDREADDTLYTWAGPEIAVATTKAYSTQLVITYLLAIYFAELLGKISSDEYQGLISELQLLPEYIEKVLTLDQQVKQLAASCYTSEDVYFIGRNLDSAICLEGSLKLKEIAYIHSEAYAAGELKHGPISLLEEGTLVAVCATYNALFDKTVSNIEEVKARGARIFGVTTESHKEKLAAYADYTVAVPDTNPMFLPSLAIVPFQMFAYYIASMKGCDIDKPRNLAKSVTVE